MTAVAVFSGDLWAGAEVMISTLLTELHRAACVPLLALSMNEGTLTERLRAAGIETHVIPERRHGFPRIVLQALRLLGGREVRVIHSHRYKEHALATALAAVLRPRRLLATVHGLPEPPARWRRLPDPAAGLNTALLRRRFDHVVAVSHDIRRRLTGDLGLPLERVSVIHNGLRLPDPAGPTGGNGAERRDLHVGSVGRLVPVKDFDLFLETAARIRARRRGVRFSILGDGPCRGELFRKAVQLGIAESFQILPPMADPLPYYRALDVYLNTSRHEGIPMSILEAMACGVPVVAPAVGGIPEVVSHDVDGFLVAGRTAADYAETCLGLLGEDARRWVVGRRAQETVAGRFSAAVMAARYLELYGTRA
jgi:glycosyltransferase involved in cell wall biosynthesis